MMRRSAPDTIIPESVGALEWQDRAACATADPELFFPEADARSTREAKRVCGGCPVRVECLTSAIANREEYGVWGGLTERERRRALARAGEAA
jgi:WhiB family redox-sensing transcriptional regulator